MRPIDAHHNGVRWEGTFAVERPGRWEFGVEAWIDLFATWRDELARKVAAAQDDLAGELSEGAVLLEAALGRAKGAADKRTIQHALSVVRDAGGARAEALRRGALARARRGDGARAGAPRHHPHRQGAAARRRPRAGALRRLVRAVPALLGRHQGRRGAGSRDRRARLRRALHDPDPPDRRSPTARARNNTLVAGPDDPGSPVRGRRQGGRPRRRAPGAGHGRGRPRAVRHGARARHGRVHGLRHQRVRRPPVADRPSGVVPPPPGRHAQVRGEPAQALPGHLQRQLGVRGLARPVGGMAADLPVLGRLPA